MKRVYVVSRAPLEGGVGGFDWFTKEDDARSAMIERMQNDLSPIRHSYSFVPLDVPTGDREAVTQYIDKNLHLVEVGC
jgi:hypothetical protein